MAESAGLTTAGEPEAVRPGALAILALLVLPALAVVGANLPVVAVPGANLFAFRLAVLAAAFFPLLIRPRLSWLEDGAARFYALMGAVWLFWGGLAVFWAASAAAAAVNLLAVAFGFVTVLALANLRANTREGIRWLLRGWVVGAVVAGGIAVWEFTTGQHLPSSWLTETPAYARRFVVVSTFDNPNNYGAFLLLVTAIVLYQMETTGSRTVRWGLFAFLLWLLALAVLTTSKVAVAGLLLVIVVYLMRGVRNKLTAAALVVAIVGGLLAAFTYLPGDFELIADILLIGADGLRLEQSNLVRFNLLLAGLDMTASTYGLGVGGGNFSYLMERGYAQYWTDGIVDPHNWWIEVLSQYGVVVFSMYMGFLAYVALLSVRWFGDRGSLTRFLMTFVIAFALSGFANSSYVSQPTNWLFLGTILMIVSCAKDEVRRARANLAGEVDA